MCGSTWMICNARIRLSQDRTSKQSVNALDPDAAYFSKGDKVPTLGYFDNYLMDNASCVIVGVEETVASPSEEITSARTMLSDCVEKFGVAPKTLAADAGYGKAEFSRGLRTRESLPISLCGCIIHRVISSTAWIALLIGPETKSFECPEGRELKYRGIKPAVNRSHVYRSTEAQCRGCSRKAECTSGRYKQLVIHVEEEVRQRARLRVPAASFLPPST